MSAANPAIQQLPTLSIIGAGSVGKTLSKLWHSHHICRIEQVYCTSHISAEAAVDFIGAGRAISRLTQLHSSDYLLIATPDDAIEAVIKTLAANPHLNSTATKLFHCSGSLTSAVLKSATQPQLQVASAHPIKTFPNASRAVEQFSGTYVALEGDQVLCHELAGWFSSIGAVTFNIDAENKPLYHAANSWVCNFLVGLIDSGLQLFDKAGIAPDDALKAVLPMMRETLNNVEALGCKNALTGPIARGDLQTLYKQAQAIQQHQPQQMDLFWQLASITNTTSGQQHSLMNEWLNQGKAQGQVQGKAQEKVSPPCKKH